MCFFRSKNSYVCEFEIKEYQDGNKISFEIKCTQKEFNDDREKNNVVRFVLLEGEFNPFDGFIYSFFQIADFLIDFKVNKNIYKRKNNLELLTEKQENNVYASLKDIIKTLEEEKYKNTIGDNEKRYIMTIHQTMVKYIKQQLSDDFMAHMIVTHFEKFLLNINFQSICDQKNLKLIQNFILIQKKYPDEYLKMFFDIDQEKIEQIHQMFNLLSICSKSPKKQEKRKKELTSRSKKPPIKRQKK